MESTEGVRVERRRRKRGPTAGSSGAGVPLTQRSSSAKLAHSNMSHKSYGGLMALDGLPPTISVEQAAELLGVSRSAAYRAAKAGQLVTFRVGRRLLVPTAPLLRVVG
jgi:excisionase family DNA binding protein